MKAKSTNKLVSLALALFMLLMSVPFSMFATTVRAEEADPNVHVFDSSTMEAHEEKGDFTDGQEVVYEGDSYFTLYMGKNTKIDKAGNSYKWEEEDKSLNGPRLNFGGSSTVGNNKTKNVIAFTTSGAATVKVWYMFNQADRMMTIWNEAGEVVEKAQVEGAKSNDTATAVFVNIKKAGKYFLGADPNSNYIFRVEVTETPATKDYTLNADALETVAKTDTNVEAGTDKYFTIKNGDKGRVVEKEQKFDDGYVGKKDLDFNGTTDSDKLAKGLRVIEFTAADKGQVKLWWVSGGDARNIQLWKVADDGTTTEVVSTTKNNKGAYIDTLKFDEAGKYYLGCPSGTCLFYKVVVTEGEIAEVVRAPWDKVAAPEIKTAVQTEGKNEIVVTVSAVVGANGGDNVSVTMLDKDSKEVDVKKSLAEKDTHEITFTAKASGEYTFKATLSREGEDDKTSKEVKTSFKLPLGAPTISSVTSKGNGTVEVVWGDVAEATEYEVFVDGTSKGKTDKTTYMVTGLEVGKEYSITVAAIRDKENGTPSKASTVTTTQEEQMTWGFMYYGTSTEAANSDNTSGNGVIGDLNADKKITLFSLGNKGKFNEKAESDGLAFYYTAIPTSKNFTLRAKIHVDSWTLSGQEGIAVMAIDSLPGNGYSAPNSTGEFYSNFYRAGALRFAYKYDSVKGLNDTEGDTYNMYLGIGIQSKTGIVKDSLEMIYNPPKGVTVDKNDYMDCGQYALETLAAEKGLGQGKYDTIGNCTNTNTFDNDAVANITDFIIELQRNNTGYFISYYTDEGTLVRTQKFYDPKALDQLDSDYVYVGFAAARAMKATISDVTVKTIDPKDDDPAEERPVEKIEPKVSFASSSIANAPKYDILLKANVKGSATIIVGGKPIIIGLAVDGTDEYTSYTLDIAPGTNKIEVKFTPDADQELPEYTELSTTDAVTFTLNVAYNTYFEKQNNIYVAPNGTKNGNGSKEYPLDIYTAVKVARPGQTIILMNGTYKLEDTLTIERSIKGTKDKMITMIGESSLSSSSTNAATAAAAAATKTERPVLDFQGKAGMVAVGDYWYFKGFDVTNSKGGTPGVLVSGSYCTYDDIKAYANGDCGIYIRSKGNSADPKSLYPSYNLILNCEAYNNADPAGGNGDGFGAKETVGVGNIFDGCVAHNNGDDGWDLFARGKSIESVTIKNCIAFENGHNADGTIKGDGNGFKMGGNSLAGGHKIINSIAFNNDQNGITCNSCPDIEIYNCISFNNGGSNVALYTGNKKLETAFKVEGVISFRKDTTGSEKLEPQTQKVDDLKGENNYYWEGKSVNNAGKEITADMFESLTYSGYSRAADGKLILNDGFLALKEGTAPEELLKLFVSLDGNYGDDYANSDIYTVRGSVTITEDDPDDLPSPSTGFGIAIVVAVIAISAAAAIVLFKKRKSSK